MELEFNYIIQCADGLLEIFTPHAMLPTIPDSELYSHRERVAGKVVIITGAASGIGRQAALDFAKHGAKVVIGDVDIAGAEVVRQSIISTGGQAVSRKCDISSWDDQLALFQFALKTYGSIDVVVANAGIIEKTSQFSTVDLDEKDSPTKPNLKALEVNINGTIYTTRLALHYLRRNPEETNLEVKSLVLLGSLASWSYLPDQPLYTASKHAVLGLMRTLYPIVSPLGIRIACIHPFFVRTNLLSPDIVQNLDGYRVVPVERVAGAIFYAATDDKEESNGCSWVLDDDGPVVQILKEEFKVDLYQRMDERRQSRLDSEKN